MKFLLPFLMTACVLAAQTAQPGERKDGTAAPSTGRLEPVTHPAYLNLKYPPLRPFKIPEIPEFTLPNGIHVYLLENHELPLVGGFALIRTGTLLDPAGKGGLAEITAHLIRTGGTTRHTGDQLDQILEDMAAAVESSASPSSARVGFNCLKENTDAVLTLFKEVLTQPAFRPEKIELIKGQYRGIIARRNDDASGILGREFTRIVYGPDTPYGRQVEYSDLENIKRDDLIAFYKRYYFPANTVVAMQGDFVTSEMRGKLERLFADWTVKQPPPPPIPDVTAKPAPGIYLAAKEDVTQTFFEIGHLGGVLKDPNYPALEVMADILGGGFASRLFKDVRTAKGLAYNINASWGAGFLEPGLFSVSGSTKSASTVDAIQAARDEIARMRTDEVTDEELQTSKDTVLNSFVFNFDSPSKTLSRVVTYTYNHYPADFIFQYQKAIEKVTKGDVLRVAKQYLHPENLTIVAVGKPQDFGKPLTTLGQVKNIDLRIPPPPGTAAAVGASATAVNPEAAAKPDAASIAKGKQLLERAQAAAGGADRLAAIHDVTETSEATVNMGPTPIKATQLTQLILPGTLRQTQNLPFGKMTVYSNGETGWMIGPQGQMPLTGPVLQQVQDETFHQIVNVLLSNRDAALTVSAAGDNAIEITGNKGQSVRVDLDAATGLPTRETYHSVAIGTAPQTVVESYAGWRDAGNGVKLPYKITIDQGGKRFADITVQSWKLNSSLTPEELSKKP